jgi:hypothetical protein
MAKQRVKKIGNRLAFMYQGDLGVVLIELGVRCSAYGPYGLRAPTVLWQGIAIKKTGKDD